MKNEDLVLFFSNTPLSSFRSAAFFLSASFAAVGCGDRFSGTVVSVKAQPARSQRGIREISIDLRDALCRYWSILIPQMRRRRVNTRGE